MVYLQFIGKVMQTAVIVLLVSGSLKPAFNNHKLEQSFRNIATIGR